MWMTKPKRAIGLIFGLSALLSTGAIGDPGDLDFSYQVSGWMDPVIAMVADGEKLIVQTNYPAVQRLKANGWRDGSFDISWGIISFRGAQPGLHRLPNGHILAMYPPRIINAEGGTVRSLLDDSNSLQRSARDGALLADGSILIAHPRGVQERILIDGTQGSVDPALSDTDKRWNRFIPAGENRWLVLGNEREEPVNLRRITSEGVLDESFQPPAASYFFAIVTNDDMVCVVYESSNWYRPTR